MTVTSINYQTPAFKGISKTENGTPYHKANGGLWVGGTYAALQGLSTITERKSGGKLAWGNLITGAAGLGCGLIVDHIRNKNAKEAAEQIKQYGLQNAMLVNHNIQYTDANTPYYKSNDGAKNGALLGLGCGALIVAHTYTSDQKTKILMDKLPNLKSKASAIALTLAVALPFLAFGGWIMGKITDHFNNKSAQKASKAQTYQQKVFNG